MADVTRTAGWYPDPDGGAGERWWNGAGWSDSRRAGAAVVPPSVPLAPSVIYSADNPAPQRPDPYSASPSSAAATSGRITVAVNRNAMIGFITGLIALFANVLYILAPVSVVFSALGIVKARRLSAQGVTNNLMVFAFIGLIAGAIAFFIGLFQLVALIGASLDLDLSSRIGA